MSDIPANTSNSKPYKPNSASPLQLSNRSRLASSSNSALHRRLLFPHITHLTSIPEIFPSDSAVLDDEIYEFISLALRAYVTPWWSKISRHDKEFVPYISSVLVHAIRSLTARVELVDMFSLFCRDLPLVITQHYVDYRAASTKVGTSYAIGGAASLEEIFHQTQFHVAISSDGQISPQYLRNCIDEIIKSCLPVEDYESEAERYIIVEVVVNVLLQEVVPRIVQPWFIHKMLLTLLKEGGDSSPRAKSKQSRFNWIFPPFTFRTIMVAILSTVQTITALGLTLVQLYQKIYDSIEQANSYIRKNQETTSSCNNGLCILDMFSTIFTMRERAASSALLIMLELIIDAMHTLSDKILSYIFYNYYFNRIQITSIIRSSKAVLFPNGYPGLPPPDPMPEEQVAIKEELIECIQDRIPRESGPLSSLINVFSAADYV